MFQILCNFIEKEKPGERIDWKDTKQTESAWKEIKFLYKWWKKVRPKRKAQNPLNGVDYPEHKFVEQGDPFLKIQTKYKSRAHEKKWKKKREESLKWEQQCHKEDTEMMQCLIKIRDYLWT